MPDNSRRTPIPVVCALIERNGTLLIAQRPRGKHLAGLWEFAGGKVNDGEEPAAAILREIQEELGCSMPDIQMNFNRHIDSPAGMRAREVLNGSIRKKVTDIIQELVQRFGDDRPRHGLANEALTRVLRDRSVYYCGGGGVYRALQIPNNHFSDVKQVSLNEMGIQNLTNTIHPPFDTILAVSYGLSILSDAELVATPLDELFQHLDGGEGFRRNVREYLE
jgi:mutator protein MutT